MSRWTWWGFLAGVCLVCGCGDNQDATLRQLLASMNEAADVMGGIKDGASAKEAQPRLKKLKERIRERKRKADAAKVNPEKESALEKQYAADIEAAAKKMALEAERIAKIPEAVEALKEADAAEAK